jgi:hypothetical protein
MSCDHDKLPGPSLAQHFDAPEDYLGHFGWISGYSADAPFLNDAAERFTRLTFTQRAHLGRIALGVLLDPGNPAITLLDTPGVAHLPIRDVSTKPFRLLHAKIALLGFRHAQINGRWRLRLIVSTGNWTRQTLEESLDLVWRIDVDSEMLAKPDSATRQACADIKAAHKLLQWMEENFDTRLLSVVPQDRRNETEHARGQLDGWVGLCSGKAQGHARFFDSRKGSLLGQLSEQIEACGNDVARNYLAMGSGFYETAADQNRLPVVPAAIIKTLKNKSLLTQNPEVDLFVNPQACQAIATSVTALNEQGITTRPAAQPSSVFGAGKARTLHAKFLFSANYRENSNVCNSAWVYLGSGNLTTPGFAKEMSASGGNLEAGVVFAPENLYWEEKEGIESWQVVSNLLPIQWSEDCNDSPNQLQPGGGMEPREPSYIAPPVAWLNWWEGAEGNELRSPEAVSDDFVVLDLAGNACPRGETGFQWLNSQPRQVRCRWSAAGEYHQGDLPVVDAFGRIAATQLPAIDLDEAFWQLADFPLPPDDDEGYPDGDAGDAYGDENSKGTHAVISSYPIRQMMELIESIAAKQTEIIEIDWCLWCLRLEQTLGQAKECIVVKAFQGLGLNPLSPLRHAAFRPAYAETGATPAGQLYESALARIEKAWAVDRLKAIGGQ